ncbi:TPA: hypothetical protein ACG8E0_002667, partial [Enterococcus faecium]|uniref:hypothetical protein n=3 Tax=Enterococcus faecium TaxID=1352 RepID=UPI001A9C951F
NSSPFKRRKCLFIKKRKRYNEKEESFKNLKKEEGIGKNELFEQKFYKMRVIIFVLILFLIK